MEIMMETPLAEHLAKQLCLTASLIRIAMHLVLFGRPKDSMSLRILLYGNKGAPVMQTGNHAYMYIPWQETIGLTISSIVTYLSCVYRLHKHHASTSSQTSCLYMASLTGL